MADQDTELSTERPQTSTTRFSTSSRSPSFGEAIEKPPALSPDETQAESSGSPLDEENPPLGSPHERNLTDDDDSTYEEDAESTESLQDEHVMYINKRIYTTFVPDVYSWTPTDDCVIDVMDLINAISTELFDGELCQAPVMNKTQRVLDVGTGTGIWAINFADSNPEAEVFGSDISCIQPGWVPPNLSFVIENFNQSWTWKEDHFDYVHLRNLTGNVHDWSHLFRQAFQCLGPNGYLESHEQSLCFHREDPFPYDADLEDSIKAIESWNSIFRSMEHEHELHRSFTVADDETQKEAMSKAGFVDLKRYYKQIPIGNWAKDGMLKEIGMFQLAALLGDLEGLLNYPATELGWSFEEIVLLLMGSGIVHEAEF
ncbi:Hypothetical protein NCS54_01214400 [Fusarium falciforme]|uniref:Hypothetical protein n=1 Tax=Fusarium falciforme TaxID=195108 RepID=UPI0023011E3B|nr:Hypothetical protein NCS54_01214400 [Fusarium falciforme]WAO94555.1 Hypothetical protein NCS54_01214400 [Fusarium falciforme]